MVCVRVREHRGNVFQTRMCVNEGFACNKNTLESSGPGNRAVCNLHPFKKAPGPLMDAHQPHINPSVQSINDS